MHFGLHRSSEEDAETIEAIQNTLPRRYFDFSRSGAKTVYDYAERNGFDTDFFRYVIGLYSKSSEDPYSGGDPDDLTFVYPEKTLDTDEVRQLHEFIEEVLADIEEKYPVEELSKKSSEARDRRPRELFDEETAEAYLSWIRLQTLQKLTSAAVEHDLMLYYGEGDPGN